jgi:hypothetical protein
MVQMRQGAGRLQPFDAGKGSSHVIRDVNYVRMHLLNFRFFLIDNGGNSIERNKQANGMVLRVE